MGEFKGTPGPWIWADRNQGLYGAGPDNAVLAFYSYEGMHLSGKTEESQEANARLIAAAPDLLGEATRLIERLSEFECELEDDAVAREFYGHVSPAIANLKYAISKALGDA